LSYREARCAYCDDINVDECRRLAECWVEITSRGSAVIVDDATLAKPYGWIFFCQSRAYLESGNFSDILAGNATLIVDRFDGELRVTGTARSIEEYLAAYESTLPPARLQ
jgi:Immunity protein 35